MKFVRYLIFFHLTISGCLYANAAIWLPDWFSDDMIFQQKTTVSIWGKTTHSEKVMVKVSWLTDKVFRSVADKAGNWKIEFQTPAAGGPYEVSVFSDNDKVVLKNVLVGEVWFCSGQSNMAVSMQGNPDTKTRIKNAIEHIRFSDNNQIRLYKVKKNNATEDIKNSSGRNSWSRATPESVAQFSAVAYLYAKYLQEVLKIPVGIIMSAVGGTKIEAWMSEKKLQQFGIGVVPAGANKVQSSDLFKAMIEPYMGFSIKGFLWYQGEGNHGDPHLYEKLLPAMVEEWRNGWRNKQLPFYFVQIAPYKYKGDGSSALMRQIMAECVNRISNSGIAILTDVGQENQIHPCDKETVAHRLAFLALANTYKVGNITASTGPVYDSYNIKGNQIWIQFKNAAKGLSTFGEELLNFEIAGKDTIYVGAHAKIVDNAVVVWNDSITNPIAARYAFKDWVVGELYNTEGLPASSFQTLEKSDFVIKSKE